VTVTVTSPVTAIVEVVNSVIQTVVPCFREVSSGYRNMERLQRSGIAGRYIPQSWL